MAIKWYYLCAQKKYKRIIVMNIVLDVLRYLNEHGITLVRAAEATGVAQQNIKKSIGNNPKTSTLLALAKGLGVDPREFFYDLDCKEKEVEGSMQENLKLHLSEAADVTEEGTDGQNGGGSSAQSDYTEEASNSVATTAFCPHCGARVRVGVVLLPEP